MTEHQGNRSMNMSSYMMCPVSSTTSREMYAVNSGTRCLSRGGVQMMFACLLCLFVCLFVYLIILDYFQRHLKVRLAFIPLLVLIKRRVIK